MNNTVVKFGKELYLLNTGNGQHAISIEVASMMTEAELEAILHYSFVVDFDFVSDKVAFDSIYNCCFALATKKSTKCMGQSTAS